METIKYTEKQFNDLVKIRESTIDRCPKCKGSGFLKDREECVCRQVLRWCEALTRANIPRAYWQLDIEELHIKDVVKNVVIEYLNYFDNAVQEGLGFVFSGECGIGKTSLMCEIGKHALIMGKSVFYCLADDYVRSIMQPDILNTKKPIDEFDVVLLDELDKVYMRQGSDFSVNEIEKFLRNKLPFNTTVIIATNATEDELLDKFRTSVVSIIKRHLKFVEFEGEDYSDNMQNDWVKKLRKDKQDYIKGNLLKYSKVYCKRNKG